MNIKEALLNLCPSSVYSKKLTRLKNENDKLLAINEKLVDANIHLSYENDKLLTDKIKLEARLDSVRRSVDIINRVLEPESPHESHDKPKPSMPEPKFPCPLFVHESHVKLKSP